MRSPDRALLIAPSKPDCTFQEIGLGDTVPVAEDTARRKLEFERACYRRAEMQMRARLRRLQAAVVAGSMPPACALTSRTERSHCVGVVRTTFCDAWQK